MWSTIVKIQRSKLKLARNQTYFRKLMVEVRGGGGGIDGGGERGRKAKKIFYGVYPIGEVFLKER